MTKEEYQNKSKFNLTHMIEQNFIEKNELINTLISKMDFSQVSQLSFISNIQLIDKETGKVTYRGLNNTVEQSLAVNCVENLPLSHYKQFITADWINSGKNHNDNMISHALIAYKYDFIDYLVDLASEKYNRFKDNDSEFSKYADDYATKLISPLLNIGQIINNLNSELNPQERYDSSYNLFKKAINLFPVHFKKYYQRAFDEDLGENDKNKINDKNWFLYYNELNKVFSVLDKKENILKYVLENEKNFNIYLDIYNQLESIKDNSLKNNSTLERAIVNGNTLVVHHLAKKLDLNTVQLSKKIHDVFSEQTLEFKDNYNAWEGSIYDNEDYRNYISNIKLLFKVIDSLPGYTIKDFSTISSVVLLDSTYVKEFIKKHPEIQHQPIVQNCTIREWLQAEELFKDFIKEEGLTTNNEENPITYDLLVVSKLKDFVEPSSKEENNKTAIQNLIINNYLSKITSLTKQESCAIFNMNVLNKKIPNKEDKIKSKIKI